MTTPLVTIYITNYNYSRYLEQAIESVLHQSFQDIELYIIDDGSTDGSEKIIERYASIPHVHIIYQHNKGLNITNNIALRVAKGKYIMRLDADDHLSLDATEKMVNMLESDPSIGLVFPDHFYVNENNEVTGEVRRFDFSREVSLLDLPAHGACTMIRRSVLVDLGGYDEDFTCQDGYDLWLKFIGNYKVANINEPLFYYRRHNNNLTSNEERILSTRRNIKSRFIDRNKIEVPDAIAVIPVRTTYINGQDLALMEMNGRTFLERVCITALEASRVKHVVITSAEEKYKEYFLKELQHLSDRISFIERPAQFARLNETLANTVLHVLDQEYISSLGIGTIMTLALEYPFITPDTIDDALNTHTIFGANSLISVRGDTKSYYQHVGNGLQPILGMEKFTQFERETLYKAVGGIMVSGIESFRKNGKMLNGKVGHIIIDAQQALGIFNDFDLKMVQLLMTAERSVKGSKKIAV